MKNTNILPLSAATYEDQHIYWVDRPIVVEGIKYIFYGANGSVAGNNIAVASMPVNSPSITLDADDKGSGTYQQTPRNMFVKKGSVIPKGGALAIDDDGAMYPSAVWDPKQKRFLVYYLGYDSLAPLYSICVAFGLSYNTLVKYYPGGTTTAIITPPAGYVVSAYELKAEYNKEENLFKLWYSMETSPGGAVSRWLATSRDGIAF